MSRRIVSRKIVVALMASVALVAISLPNNAMAFGGGHGGGGGGHFGGGGGHFGGGGGHFGGGPDLFSNVDSLCDLVPS